MSSSKAYLSLPDLQTWLPEVPGMADVRFGVAALEKPLSMNFYDEWLASDFHGEMEYLKRHRDAKADATQWLPMARSALVFAINYVTPTTPPLPLQKASNLRTAFYTRFVAESGDYHVVLRERLSPVVKGLESRYPGHTFRMAIDTAPILERDLAVRAGLGWVGKNTCVIDRTRGSLFFIAEILTSLEIESSAATITVPDFCGTCTRCMDSCPTGALVAPRSLDARKCISYWTIEAKSLPPNEISDKFGDWFFGCDICQTVCPWNEKVFGRERMESESSPILSTELERSKIVEDLKNLLEASHREIERRFKDTPLSRSRGFGLKRNALIVAGNLRLHELTSSVRGLLNDPKLEPLAKATLQKLAAEP